MSASFARSRHESAMQGNPIQSMWERSFRASCGCRYVPACASQCPRLRSYHSHMAHCSVAPCHRAAEMDAEWQDFLAFAEERLELRPTGVRGLKMDESRRVRAARARKMLSRRKRTLCLLVYLRAHGMSAHGPGDFWCRM